MLRTAGKRNAVLFVMRTGSERSLGPARRVVEKGIPLLDCKIRKITVHDIAGCVSLHDTNVREQACRYRKRDEVGHENRNL